MSVDVQGQINYWIKGADDNLETAPILIRHDKFLEALFFLHLATEKALKAHVVKVTGNVPPRTHNLLRLAELANVSPDEATIEFLGRLMIYQLEGRYPSEKPLQPSKKFTRQMLEKSREVNLWLKNQL